MMGAGRWMERKGRKESHTNTHMHVTREQRLERRKEGIVEAVQGAPRNVKRSAMHSTQTPGLR